MAVGGRPGRAVSQAETNRTGEDLMDFKVTRRIGAVLAASAAVCLITAQAVIAEEAFTPEAYEGLARGIFIDPAPAPELSKGFEPFVDLYVCPKIRVSNRPPEGPQGRVKTYHPIALANGKVPVAVMPTTGSCMTSGFGPRNGRAHKGIDYQGKPAPMVVAAADGVVLEAYYRKDYGNMVLIDHGDGVYTRYAHLEYFAKGVQAGDKVSFGQDLGKMGRTSDWPVALHLHYEILTGDYGGPKKSFGLTAVDPLSLPRAPAAE